MAGTYRLPALDTEFLLKWSPARFAVLGLMGYAVLLVVSPLTYNLANFAFEPTVYWVVALLGFFGGCQVAKVVNNLGRPASVQPVTIPPDFMINITLVLGFVGVVARSYDRVVVRGFTVAETLLESRETVAEALSPFSYVGGLFFSFGIVAVSLFWLTSSYRRRPAAYAFAILLAAYPMLEALLTGGRSVTIHTLFLLFMCARASGVMSWLVRSPVALLCAGLAVVAGAQLLYEIRTLQVAGDEIDLADVFKLTAMARYAQPWDWVVDQLVSTNGQGLFSEVLKVWTHSTQSLTHSWLVFYDNYLHFDGTFGWGRLHFFMLVRILSGLVGEDLSYDPTLYGLEGGISGTSFSTIYYDFGAVGPLAAAAFGYAATLVQRKAIMFPERWLLLYVYLCFTCLMMMLDNQLIGSLGAFAIWTFGLYVPFHFLITFLSGHRDGGEPEPLSAAAQRLAALRQGAP